MSPWQVGLVELNEGKVVRLCLTCLKAGPGADNRTGIEPDDVARAGEA
jgi:hypothetical protein